MDPLLIESGLFGRGLVPIDTPEGVARYNEALIDLGCTPTKLEQFEIDGSGFAPKIAAEQGNRDYLSHGVSNQCAIIASPDQKNKPIMFPPHTYIRPALREWWRRSQREAADATTDSCIRITFEQNAGDFTTAKDIMFLEKLVVQASAGPITDAAREQRKLLEEFTATPNNWIDATLRTRICQSGKKYGDLTRRHLEIPDLTIAQIEDFWSRAFGGVFVLTAGKDKILIVEDDTLLPSLKPERGERYKVFSLAQKNELVEHLREEHLIELDPKYYREHPEELTDIKSGIVADFVCRVDPECDLHTMSVGTRKAILNSNKEEVPILLPQLERFQRNLTGRLGKLQQKQLELPFDLELMLLAPTEQAGESAHPVLRMLLLRLQEKPMDVMRLYAYDKERFFALFETWPTSKKRWAAKFIMAKYKPEMEKR